MTTANQRVIAFWGPDHWRNQFRILPPAHSGFDIGGHRAGMMIPALRAGRVSAKGYDKNYGYWVSWKISKTVFLIVCHMLHESPQEVGMQVDVGEGVGLLGATGAFAVGFHAHLTESKSAYPWTRPTINPKPVIIGALAAASKPTIPAGNNGTPITPTPPSAKEHEMRIIFNTDATVPDAQKRALVGEFSFQPITPGESTRERKLWGEPENVSAAEWAAIKLLTEKRAAAVNGSSAVAAPIDLAPILDAIKQVPVTVINLLKAQWSK